MITARTITPWSMSTVGAHFDIQLGKMLDAARNIGVPKPYVGNRAVQWGHIDVSAAGVVPLTRADQIRYRLKRGDLLVCEGGEVGRAAIWRDELRECYYQKALHRLRPKADFDPRVMLALLEYWSQTNRFTNFVTQTSIAHLPRVKFLTMPLPLIPPGEQQRIAEFLDNSNDLIAMLERLIAKKQAIKLSMMQQLLTGKTRLPGFTSEWAERAIVDLAMVDPQTLAPWTSPSEVIDYISLEDVSRGVLLNSTQFTFRSAPSRARRVIREMDILFGTVRPNLQSHVMYFGGLSRPVASTGFAVVRALAGRADPMFVFYLLMSNLAVVQIDRIIAGSNYPAVTSRDVRNLRFKVPEVSEQVAIGVVLADCEAEIRALESRLSKATAVKKGMMQELLTGRTRLRIQEAVA